jgi:hypothetical protein
MLDTLTETGNQQTYSRKGNPIRVPRRFVPSLIKLPFGEMYKRLMLLCKSHVLTHRIVPMQLSLRQLAHVANRAFGVENVVEF